MNLTDTAIRNAKPADKPIKLYDGDGLYLLVSPAGHRGWRFKYFFGGKEKLLSFGRYPEITLKIARERRLEARRLSLWERIPAFTAKQNVLLNLTRSSCSRANGSRYKKLP